MSTNCLSLDQNRIAHQAQQYDTANIMAMIDLLHRSGWEFDLDRYDPRPEWRGWWVNPQHPTKCRRTGDAKEQAQATFDTVALYTEITPDDVFNRTCERAARARAW